MMLNKRKFGSIIAAIVILSLLLSTNSSAILAADTSSTQNVYSDSEVTIESKIMSADSGVMSFQYENSSDDFSIYAYNVGSEDYYVETYDAQGNLLNYIVQEGNVLIQYDAQGNEVVRNDLGTIESEGNESGAISPLAIQWGDKGYRQGDLTAEVSRGVTFVVSIITAVLLAQVGISGFANFAIKNLIKDLAERMVYELISQVYYSGWVRSGWEYGVSYREVSMNYYRYSNYSGFIKNVSGIELVH